MRTTLSIDDDVLAAVRERARREKRTVGEVLTELARRALTGQRPPESHGLPEDSARIRHGFIALPHRGPAVSNSLIDTLRDDEGV